MQARWFLQGLVDGRGYDQRQDIVELVRMVDGQVPYGVRYLPSQVLLRTILAAIQNGILIVVPDERDSMRIASGERSIRGVATAEVRVVADVMEQRADLPFEGRRYRVIPAERWAAMHSDDYEVVQPEDARVILRKMGAAPQTASGKKTSYEEAASLVTPKKRPERGDPGILLLRRRPQIAAVASNQEPALTPSQLKKAMKADFELIIVESASGRPVPEVALVISTPSGEQKSARTDSAGKVKLSDLERGNCEVKSVIEGARSADSYQTIPSITSSVSGTSAPSKTKTGSAAYLVDATRHRVRSGQTPESIAQESGVAWPTIATFNWGTSDPSDLESHYHDTLGCRKKNANGRELVFDDQDDPGIILIPRPWVSALAVGTSHKLFVQSLNAVTISLVNEIDLPIPGARYEVRFESGIERHGILGRSGVARLDGAPEEAFSVVYPDQVDILAKSLAACVRKALDEQVASPLFHLLMQSREVVERATSAYDEYFNDLTGRGLVADIDQVITDPEARRPLLSLCAMAGLSPEGVGHVNSQDHRQGERV